ncbi:MAG: mechanosensitive ion channel [Phycisphaeraceae bacterium]|nr:mechanosensitive ion channel [Phycisphaeraceae bacterium]
MRTTVGLRPRFTPAHFFLILGTLLLPAGPTGAVPGQDAADAPRAAVAAADGRRIELTPAWIDARIAQVEADASLDDATRAASARLYREALDLVRRTEEATARGQEARRLADEAPALLAEIRAELAQPAVPQAVPDEAATPLGTLELELEQAGAQLEAIRRRLEELQGESGRRAERRQFLSAENARLRSLLSDLDARLTAEPAVPAQEPARAQSVVLLARQAQYRAEITANDSEIASFDARRDLLPARRDRQLRRLQSAEIHQGRLQEIVSARRQQEAQAAQAAADQRRAEATAQHPVLGALAGSIAGLAAERTGDAGLAARLDQAERRLRAVRAQNRGLQEQARSVERRLGVSGLNEATGLLLIRQYELVPDPSLIRRDLRARRREIADAEYRLILLEDERSQAGDIESQVRAYSAEIGDDGQAADLEPILRELLGSRRTVLDQAIGDLRLLHDRLLELEVVEQELLDLAQAFRAFIAERIFWVRSASGAPLPGWRAIGDAGAWLLDASAWRAGAGRLLAVPRERPLSLLAGMLLLAGLVLVRPRAIRAIRLAGEHAESPSTDAMRHTFTALGWTVVAALPLPALLAAAGYLLGAAATVPGPVTATEHALLRSAVIVLPFSFLRQVLRRGGLAEAHLGWPVGSIRALRHHLRWLVMLILPLGTGAALMSAPGADGVAGGVTADLARIAFIGAMLVLAIGIQRILLPSGAVVGHWLHGSGPSWTGRLRSLWYPIAILIPIALAIASWTGYAYTAIQLERRFEASLWLVILAVITHALLLRWLLLARRRLAIEAARRAREAAAAAAPPAPDTEVPTVTPADDVDIPALDARTRQLIRTSAVLAIIVVLYTIWAPVLPALRMLDRVELYPRMVVRPAMESPATQAFTRLLHRPSGTNGTPAAGAVDPATDTTDRPRAGSADAPPRSAPGTGLPMVPGLSGPGGAPDAAAPDGTPRTISLADLGVALLVLIATIAAVRNVPGLMEMILLQRLPMDAGSRNALTTITRYALTILGVTVGFNAIGITWNSIQWLAAALTFGLAFGLQEIFANFISGLIILAERPIRVGDVVTVNGVSGTVAQIRMRATTILDFDRKELIVPNKSFITGQIINWTLSDPRLRIVIPVGASYGSDPTLVEETLLEVARANPDVMTDPGPSVVFGRFGDSTLDFELRVFVPSIDRLVAVRHDMHRSILRRFREKGIEIAFPQRDLHIRTLPGGVPIPADVPAEPVPRGPSGGA